jgi:hypothetical protein
MTGSWRGTQNQRLINALDAGRSVAEVARELRRHVRCIYEGEQKARTLRERFRRERAGAEERSN